MKWYHKIAAFFWFWCQPWGPLGGIHLMTLIVGLPLSVISFLLNSIVCFVVVGVCVMAWLSAAITTFFPRNKQEEVFINFVATALAAEPSIRRESLGEYHFTIACKSYKMYNGYLRLLIHETRLTRSREESLLFSTKLHAYIGYLAKRSYKVFAERDRQAARDRLTQIMLGND